MAAVCLCRPSESNALLTDGFVCGGQCGRNAHWLCKHCTGPRNTCLQHPRAPVVPVNGLWGETRFEPEKACAPPGKNADAPPLLATQVRARAVGRKGIQIQLQPGVKVQEPMVIKLTLADTFGFRYAVAWPGQAEAWTFPRTSTTAAGAKPPDKIAVRTVAWWRAWSPDNTTLLGLTPARVASIMKSPCSRTRWWFLMPKAEPPLAVPSAVMHKHGMTQGTPNLGPQCDVPLRPYDPLYETTTGGGVRCVWCKATSKSPHQWATQCAPDLTP